MAFFRDVALRTFVANAVRRTVGRRRSAEVTLEPAIRFFIALAFLRSVALGPAAVEATRHVADRHRIADTSRRSIHRCNAAVLTLILAGRRLIASAILSPVLEWRAAVIRTLLRAFRRFLTHAGLSSVGRGFPAERTIRSIGAVRSFLAFAGIGTVRLGTPPVRAFFNTALRGFVTDAIHRPVALRRPAELAEIRPGLLRL